MYWHDHATTVKPTRLFFNHPASYKPHTHSEANLSTRILCRCDAILSLLFHHHRRALIKMVRELMAPTSRPPILPWHLCYLYPWRSYLFVAVKFYRRARIPTPHCSYPLPYETVKSGFFFTTTVFLRLYSLSDSSAGVSPLVSSIFSVLPYCA